MAQRFKEGDRVVFTNDKIHRDFPQYYPPVGTVGRIDRLCDNDAWIQWAAGSTSDRDYWNAPLCEIAPVTTPLKTALNRLRGLFGKHK